MPICDLQMATGVGAGRWRSAPASAGAKSVPTKRSEAWKVGGSNTPHSVLGVICLGIAPGGQPATACLTQLHPPAFACAATSPSAALGSYSQLSPITVRVPIRAPTLAGLLSVALGLAAPLRVPRPTLLFRWVGLLRDACASEGCGEVPQTPPAVPGRLRHLDPPTFQSFCDVACLSPV